jgi:hypothetical protein
MTAIPLRFALPRGECHGFMCQTRVESPPATETTLYAAIIREIAAKGTAALFKKNEHRVFVAGKGA